MPVRLFLSSGAQRTLDTADSARLDDAFFIVTRRDPRTGRVETLLTLRSVDVVGAEVLTNGVYWVPLFELLEARGFSVKLVDARKVKNVSGRKSDVLDCQWLQQLESYGLLAGAYRPPDQI